MPHRDRLNPISWSIVLAVTATLALTACSSAGEPPPSPTDAEDDVSTAATAQGEPTAEVAFVCGQLNALEAARWRAAVDEGKGAQPEGALGAIDSLVFDGYATIVERAPGELSNEVATLRDRAQADPRDVLAIDEASQALGAACEEAGAPVAIIARPGEGG